MWSESWCFEHFESGRRLFYYTVHLSVYTYKIIQYISKIFSLLPTVDEILRYKLEIYSAFIGFFLQYLQREWTIVTVSWVNLGHNVNTNKIWNNPVIQSVIPEKGPYDYWGIPMPIFLKIIISNFILFSHHQNLCTFNDV